MLWYFKCLKMIPWLYSNYKIKSKSRVWSLFLCIFLFLYEVFMKSTWFKTTATEPKNKNRGRGLLILRYCSDRKKFKITQFNLFLSKSVLRLCWPTSTEESMDGIPGKSTKILPTQVYTVIPINVWNRKTIFNQLLDIWFCNKAIRFTNCLNPISLNQLHN